MLEFTKITETVTQAVSKRPVMWKCNGLIIKTDDYSILIDCSLEDYRKSLEKIKNLYSSGDCLLTSSHSSPVLKKNPDIFQSISAGIERTESALLERLDRERPVTLEDLVLTGIYYRKSSIEKMNDSLKKLYYFREYYTLMNHFLDLRHRGIVQKVDGGWLIREPVTITA